MSDPKKQPKTDMSRCVGEQVTVYLEKGGEGLESLELPLEHGKLEGRLVGVDRPGLWVEPKAWLDEALAKEDPVHHVFLKWESVLGVSRPIASEKFESKKEYRGLRPRG